MPLYTPTTPRVVASDRTPPMFRPTNQSQLVPAMPANPAASQSFLPGLGAVRSGNTMATGLDQAGDEELAQWDKRLARKQKQVKAGIKTRARALQHKLTALEAKLDSAKVTGTQIPADKLAYLKDMRDRVKEALRALNRGIQVEAQGGGTAAAPWQRQALYMRKIPKMRGGTREMRPMRMYKEMSPPTPDPLKYEPAAFSSQKRGKILDMQANVQPIRSIDGLGDIVSWATGSTLGIPNWGLAAGGGALLLLLMRRRR